MTKISYWLAENLFYILFFIMVFGLAMLVFSEQDKAIAARKQVIHANPTCVLLDEGRDGYYYMACNGSVQLMRP
jgi:hypothetical protein